MNKVLIFDTTMRDGELAPGVKMNLQQKINISQNSLIALNCGVRQIECAINGLGARKGNADLKEVVMGILQQGNYKVDIDTTLMSKASELVAEFSGLKRQIKRLLYKMPSP
ncbi:MAG: hypothetical protein KME38_03115 [Spirirestis rafaelensis WJT71-NPBG6]|jgi:isopropylmalate/homocitrate/citramalate synthase|nr:hypothetical protein [Spirirestis rafaelensis WJT71-NPBG6]